MHAQIFHSTYDLTSISHAWLYYSCSKFTVHFQYIRCSCNAYIDHNPDACPFDHSLTDPHIEDIWDDGEIYEAAPQPKEAVPQPAQIAYMCAHGLFATCVCLLRNSNPFLNHVRSRAKIRLRWTTRARAKWHVWHGLKFTHGYGHGVSKFTWPSFSSSPAQRFHLRPVGIQSQRWTWLVSLGALKLWRSVP